ncbi:MAG: serine/threonine protein kinase, partial [Bryobacterales bacterium]|nr:serine/threonine protein kinase [Bryobacterales bacterium]
MPLSNGTRLGPYEIISPLGAGGMGEVYRGRDSKLNRDVALKVLPEALAGDADYMARFQREAQVLAALNHPNIAAIYGLEDRAIVMELVEGATLAERIAQGAIPIEEALAIARQISEAFEYAHEKGVTHRDLKPANVKITPEGVVKVLDFGLAKMAEPPAPQGNPESSPTLTLTMRATVAGMILGTAAYMAPEQAAGKPVDRRADIWSFGVVLYEMLSGARLFAGETVAHTLAEVLTKELDLNRIDPGIRPLVRRCLQRDPRRRLRDMGDARLVIEEYQANPLPEVAPPAGRHSKTAWMVAGVLAAALIPASLGWFRRSPELLKPLVRFDINPGPDASMETIADRLAISPDGRRLVYGTRSPGGVPRLSSRLLEQPAGAPIAGTENAIHPFFSPDGQWLGFFSADKMKKVSLLGGAPSDFAVQSWGTGPGVDWSEDGSFVIAPNSRSALVVLPPAGGSFLPLAQLDQASKEITQRWPQVTPGGRVVLFTSNTHGGNYEDAEIVAFHRKTGHRKVLYRGGYFGRYLGPAQGPGYLVYMSRGNLFAMPMDLERLTVTEPPVQVLADVAASPIVGYAKIDYSRTGTAVFLKGGDEVPPVLQVADTSGHLRTLSAGAGVPASKSSIRWAPDGKRIAMIVTSGGGRDLWAIEGSRTGHMDQADVHRNPL